MFPDPTSSELSWSVRDPKATQHRVTCRSAFGSGPVLPEAWSVSESATKSTSFVSSTGLCARRASGRLVSLRISKPNQHHLCHLPASAPAVLPDAWSVSEFRNQINRVTSFVSSTGLCARRASGCLISLRIRNQINIICATYRPLRPCFRTPGQSQNPKPNQHLWV